jgi:hypothetical protein
LELCLACRQIISYTSITLAGQQLETLRPSMANTDLEHVSSSYFEFQNLSVPRSLRRYTRITNAFSRKLENLAASVNLYYFSCSLIKIHETLRCTPAMAAGVTDRLWEISDLVTPLEAEEQKAKRAA